MMAWFLDAITWKCTEAKRTQEEPAYPPQSSAIESKCMEAVGSSYCRMETWVCWSQGYRKDLGEFPESYLWFG